MEETTPKPAAPVVDVVAPHAPAAPPAPTPEPAPADHPGAPVKEATDAEQQAVKPAPPSTDDEAKDKPVPKPAKTEKPVKPPKPEKAPGDGVGGAIFATVVIVLALAAMATYAYIKTQN